MWFLWQIYIEKESKNQLCGIGRDKGIKREFGWAVGKSQTSLRWTRGRGGRRAGRSCECVMSLFIACCADAYLVIGVSLRTSTLKIAVSRIRRIAIILLDPAPKYFSFWTQSLRCCRSNPVPLIIQCACALCMLVRYTLLHLNYGIYGYYCRIKGQKEQRHSNNNLVNSLMEEKRFSTR